nr:hypothetical protein [Lachnospiraceae bacterium]
MNAKAKRNKKGYIVTALMLILVMTVLLAACTKAKDNGNKPTPEIDKDKIVSVDNGSNTANEPASPTKEPETASQTSETKADEDKKASELKPTKKPAEPEPTSNEPDVNNPENIEVKLLYGYEYKWDDELNTSLGYFRYQTAGLTYSDGKR